MINNGYLEQHRQQSCLNKSMQFPPGDHFKCRGGGTRTVYPRMIEVIECCNERDFCNKKADIQEKSNTTLTKRIYKLPYDKTNSGKKLISERDCVLLELTHTHTHTHKNSLPLHSFFSLTSFI